MQVPPTAVAPPPPNKWTLADLANISQIVMAVITGGGAICVIVQLWQAQLSMATAAQATVYEKANAITQLVVAHPQLREYLYNEGPPEDPRDRDERLREKLASLPDNERGLVRASIECIADSFDQMYWLRDLLPDRDWNAWWQYFQDVYDECPLLRDLYQERDDWYTIDDYLTMADTERRTASLQR